MREIRDSLNDKMPNLTYGDADFNHAINLYPCFYKHEWDTDNCTNNIILHLLAHLITKYQQQTAEGVSDTTPARVQSQTVGSVSITYAVQALKPADEAFYGDFSTTVYGKLFLSMISRQPVVRGLFV